MEIIIAEIKRGKIFRIDVAFDDFYTSPMYKSNISSYPIWMPIKDAISMLPKLNPRKNKINPKL